MIIFARLFYMVILIWMWYLGLKYRRNVKSWTWDFYWAEKYLWAWGTYIIIILICIGLICLWAMAPFGTVEKVFNWGF